MEATDGPLIAWDQMSDLYREALLDHCRSPRNATSLSDPDFRSAVKNPFCGDEVAIQICMESGFISAVGVQGYGCSICRSSASIMGEQLTGRSLEEAEALSGLFSRVMQGRTCSETEREQLHPLEALFGVRKFPTRIKCVLLAWIALDEAVGRYLKQESG
jgi:SUF system NifU family Fe-S assembly protein